MVSLCRHGWVARPVPNCDFDWWEVVVLSHIALCVFLFVNSMGADVMSPPVDESNCLVEFVALRRWVGIVLSGENDFLVWKFSCGSDSCSLGGK